MILFFNSLLQTAGHRLSNRN